ncbi:MAG: M48 family metallopeptidase [Verrucomicrobiota bacterium]
MDFFEQQDQARKKSHLLVVYFFAAALLTMLALYGVTAGAFAYARHDADPGGDFEGGKLPRTATYGSLLNATLPLHDNLPLDLDLIFTVFLSTGLIILLGSGVKTYQLSQGGRAVATMLGGRRIQPNTTDTQEQMLLNIVEEMSIASGTPVPEIYLLEEPAINAFAAGFNPTDAVIGITRGCIMNLNRDELQGVVAHEFSHILNGDMRLNMKMTSLAHGILFIASTGMLLLRLPFRMAFYASAGSRSSRDRKSGLPIQILLVILAVGAVLAVIGSIGYFFSKLLKSAVSRQREFLADAAAVQFTRNPEGIGNALKKIGGLVHRGRIQAGQAEEASHFFFANALAGSWFDWFASHPPLAERILRLDPHFDGTYPKVKPAKHEPPKDTSYQKGKHSLPPRIPGLPTGAEQVAGLVASAGQITPVALSAANQIARSLPESVYKAAHEPFGARAVAYGILLDPDSTVRNAQTQVLQQWADPAVLRELEHLWEDLRNITPRQRLVLVDLAIPALRELSPEQFTNFRNIIGHLVAADQSMSLFEYSLEKILTHHLDPHFNKVKPSIPRIQNLSAVWDECIILLAGLAYVGSDTYEEAKEAFKEGLGQLNIADRTAELPSHENAGLRQVDQALNRLCELTPMHKRNLLFACSQVVLKYRGIEDEEGELLRAIADSLGCPLPPLVVETMNR